MFFLQEYKYLISHHLTKVVNVILIILFFNNFTQETLRKLISVRAYVFLGMLCGGYFTKGSSENSWKEKGMHGV